MLTDVNLCTGTLLNKIMALQRTPVVISSGNHAEDDGRLISRFPAKFGEDNDYGSALDDLIIVGATDQNGVMGIFSQWADYITTMAPGVGVTVAKPAIGIFGSEYETESGTSFGKSLRCSNENNS
jgi:hypothetical protein